MKKRIILLIVLIVPLIIAALCTAGKIEPDIVRHVTYIAISFVAACIALSICDNIEDMAWSMKADSATKLMMAAQTRTIKVKKLNDKATIPTRGSDKAAGVDLYACIDEFVKIPPHKTVKIPTGISIELPDNTFGAIYARSGLATKKGLAPANCVGVVDSDYRGEVIVALHNNSNFSAVVQPGDRIAQMIVQRYQDIKLVEAEELSDTDRGAGGFGSTGK